MKKRILSMLVLLAAVATGAMAQTETLLTTITGAGSNTNPATSANVSYSTEGIATLTFSKPTSDGQVAYNVSPAWGWWGYAITLTETVFDDKTPKVNGTILADNSKGITKIEVYGYAAPAGYSVALKDGTEDASNWQGKAGSGEYQSLPLTSLEAGTAVSVKYNGTKKVKSVKAKKKQ